MITEYNRPATLEAALELLSRKVPKTVPLAGGTILNRKSEDDFAVVDIQKLPLKEIKLEGNSFCIGAGVTLQQLIDHPDTPSVVRDACKRESNFNLRQMSTIGGCIAAGDGRSTLLSVLLAINAEITLLPGSEKVTLGEMLPRRGSYLEKRLITAITLNTKVRVAYETISKTPADSPIVGVTVAQWPNGRTRVNVFGFGKHPVPAMDGTSAIGADLAARNAFVESEDVHASTSYRVNLAGVLTKRCLEKIEKEAA
jgi:CO/xanthine dehydrogenase FAD-binding subunit